MMTPYVYKELKKALKKETSKKERKRIKAEMKKLK